MPVGVCEGDGVPVCVPAAVLVAVTVEDFVPVLVTEVVAAALDVAVPVDVIAAVELVEGDMPLVSDADEVLEGDEVTVFVGVPVPVPVRVGVLGGVCVCDIVVVVDGV